MITELTKCLEDNPFSIAGLADWPDDDGQLFDDCIRQLAETIRRKCRVPPLPATIIYAMVRVAQEDYGGEDRGYWPALRAHLKIDLDIPQQQLLGEWFRDSLRCFGYTVKVPGLTNLGPIIWHAGCPRNHLAHLIEFVATQVSVYGERAVEPDAIHALRLGEAAAERTPPLPRALQRLLLNSPDGMDQIWSALAGAVLAYQRGGADVARCAWEDLPGINFDDVIQALQQSEESHPAEATVRRPQLRYHADTGELRLWLVDTDPEDWIVSGLTIHWEGKSGVVYPPLCEKYTLVHQPSKQKWEEQLFTDGYPAVWFGGRSGVLERGDAIGIRGLSAESWHVLIRGMPSNIPAEQRMPLELAFVSGGEGWTAWCVDVPHRKNRTGHEHFTLNVEGQKWEFPLSRGANAKTIAEEPIAWAELIDGSPVAVYCQAPWLNSVAPISVKLLRRFEGSAELATTTILDGSGRTSLPDLGSGVFQVRQSRGVGRTLLTYAVIPGFSCSPLKVTENRAAITISAKQIGTILEANGSGSKWTISQPDWFPWLVATWTWTQLSVPLLRFRWPVLGVRWRIATQESPKTDWGREAIPLDRRVVAQHQIRIEMEVPSCDDVVVNDQPISLERFQRLLTGYRCDVRPDAYPTADAIRLFTAGHLWNVAWLTERPVLSEFDANYENGQLEIVWNAVHLPPSVCLGVWDPTDPLSEVTILPLDTRGQQNACTKMSIPSELGRLGWISIALGVQIRQGFSKVKFVPATQECGKISVVLVRLTEKPGVDDWVKLAHDWTVALRHGNQTPTGVAHNIQQLGNHADWSAIRGYCLALDQLPLGSLRDRLRNDIRHTLSLAWPIAVRDLIQSNEPSRLVADWLQVGVHPGWVNPLELRESSSTVSGYPAYYFAALATLNDHSASIEDRKDASFDIWEMHKAQELFSPNDGLPLARIRAMLGSGRGLLKPQKPTNRNHVHCFHLTEEDGADDQHTFDQQVIGHDAYVHLVAFEQDQFHTSTTDQQSYARRNRIARGIAVHYASTRYAAGWREGDGGWQIDRCVLDRKTDLEKMRQCCDTPGALLAPAWDVNELFDHLHLLKWLEDRSTGVSVELPTLPEHFDQFLYSSHLGPVHRCILEDPPRIPQQLHGMNISVPKYPDMPRAGKLAWRIAWLDRTGFMHPENRSPHPDGAIQHWTPFLNHLRAALLIEGPFAELLTGCLVIAEYIRVILAGGIGPAFRFQNTSMDQAQ